MWYRQGFGEYSIQPTQALLGFVTLLSLSDLVIVLVLREHVAVTQTYILELLAFAVLPFLTYFNHAKTRSSSTILLLFWPAYLGYLALWTRTLVATHAIHDLQITFAMRWAICGVGLLAFAIECMGPEYKPENFAEDGTPIVESPLVTANIFSVWTFEWMTPLMKKGVSQFITEDDLPPLLPRDESEKLGEDLQVAMKSQYVPLRPH